MKTSTQPLSSVSSNYQTSKNIVFRMCLKIWISICSIFLNWRNCSLYIHFISSNKQNQCLGSKLIKKINNTCIQTKMFPRFLEYCDLRIKCKMAWFSISIICCKNQYSEWLFTTSPCYNKLMTEEEIFKGI